MTTRKGKIAVRKLTQAASDWRNERDAWLGKDLVSRLVETGTPGLLWARMENGKAVKVHNTVGVSADYDIHVKIGENRHQRKIWQIIRKVEDFDIPAGGGRVSYHESQHRFLGPDEIPINRKQIMQLTVRVSDSAGFIVALYGDAANTPGGLVQINNQYVDLSAEVVTEGAKFVNIEADDDGAISLHAGTAFDAPLVATIDDVPAPDPGKYLIAYVLMFEGQTGLLDEHIHVPMPLGMVSRDAGVQIDEAEVETTIADADKIGFWSIVDGILKSITWENIKLVLADVFLTDAPSDGNQYGRQDGAWEEITATPSPDADAIHVDVAGEINGIAAKTTPVGADKVVIEDSADSWAKKSVLIDDLPAGGMWVLVVDEDGTSFANFTSVAGTWSSDGTVIKQTDASASGRRAKYNTAVPMTFLIYEADIQIKSSGAARVGGLVIGFDGSTNNGPTTVILDEGNDLIKIQVDGITDLLSVAATVNVDTWYTVRALFTGGMVSIYLDGTLIGSSGNNPNRMSNASFLGLNTYQAEVWFRNVKAWSLVLP